MLQICANLYKSRNNMMSNDGLIIENMDLSHIHLAVCISNILVKNSNFANFSTKKRHFVGLATTCTAGWSQKDANLFIAIKINVLIWNFTKEKPAQLCSGSSNKKKRKKKAFICIFRSLEWEYFLANSISPFCLLPKLTFGASNFHLSGKNKLDK